MSIGDDDDVDNGNDYGVKDDDGDSNKFMKSQATKFFIISPI